MSTTPSLENVDFEQVDKEIEADEAVQAIVTPNEEMTFEPRATLLGPTVGSDASA